MVRKRVFLKTFGCRTNIYDSNIMLQNIKDFDIVDCEEDADIIVVNSCTVTNGADSSARSYINSVNKMGKKVILAGCGAISKGDELLKSDKIFGYFGHSEKSKINQLLKSDKKFAQKGDLSFVDSDVVEDFSSYTKAFIKIQEGCDFNCSYCIIPMVRGRARSMDEKRILAQIEKLALNGYGEFVLSGTNLGSYGKDTNSSIAKLLKKISQIKGVKRIRLGSLEPVQIDDEFKELLDESWIEKHLHIALQHTSEKMLRIMRRRNILKDDLNLFELIADKGFSLGTDFITGHPGESEQIWSEALKNFKSFPITHLHAFTFSKRDHTHSATIKETVAGDIAKERLKILEEIVKNNNFKFRKDIKKPLLVLVEESRGENQVGYDQFFNKVYIKSDLDLKKEWISVEEFEVKMDANYARL
ncbi:MAG: tRNA (N(6)-L-threonylcarbamoyladenosine(37)-C(2))-methylthiotransferase MtaB [Sulfurospirillum sp.]|nr:MAG: tRNA (N(6)-L-threonylcarbamoyladenosine(37)-C(2))-methylthiotransferase MtaB [Sulfurospirillum sp.]